MLNVLKLEKGDTISIVGSLPTKKTIARKDDAPINRHITYYLMADSSNKHKENVSGSFFVDDQCIDCDLCRETAPKNFTRQEDGGFSYVYKQPETDDEKAACEEAMAGCPVEAIGSDG
jgi:ferredoxin